MSIFLPIRPIVCIQLFPFLACTFRRAPPYVNPAFLSAGGTVVRVRYGGLAMSLH